tara:strand:+ start:626 stop:778 length:153 start_codon:yes stop_codon:yes gene_type:complete
LNITSKSTKQDIIEESTVIIAELDEQVVSLKQQQFALFAIAGVLLISNFF